MVDFEGTYAGKNSRRKRPRVDSLNYETMAASAAEANASYDGKGDRQTLQVGSAQRLPLLLPKLWMLEDGAAFVWRSRRKLTVRR